jgi:hypothetical protein
LPSQYFELEIYSYALRSTLTRITKATQRLGEVRWQAQCLQRAHSKIRERLDQEVKFVLRK